MNSRTRNSCDIIVRSFKNRDTHGLPTDRCLASTWPPPAAPTTPRISIRQPQAMASSALDQPKNPILSGSTHKSEIKNQIFTAAIDASTPPEIEKPNLGEKEPLQQSGITHCQERRPSKDEASFKARSPYEKSRREQNNA